MIWDQSESRFQFTDDLRVVGTQTVSGDVTVEGGDIISGTDGGTRVPPLIAVAPAFLTADTNRYPSVSPWERAPPRY